jgi:hypothetical protein
LLHRLVIFLIVLTTLVSVPASGSPVGVGTTDTFYVRASADIDSNCTPSACYYSATAAAAGCSLTGGSVHVTTNIIGGFSFGVPVAGCNDGSDGDTGEFGTNCLTVTATLVAIGLTLSDVDTDCATPIDCLRDPVKRIACIN